MKTEVSDYGRRMNAAESGRKSVLKTVIFDCGRVLTFDQRRDLAEKMAGIVGTAPDSFPAAYAAARGDYDRGTTTAAEYWGKVAARFGRRIDGAATAELVRLDMDSWFTINPDTVEIVRRLKARGYRLLILSNMNVEGKERLFGEARIVDGEDWTALFDDILLSCDLGLLKPEHAIYRACLERTEAEPGECLFIDDMPANAEAARECGMRALHFTGAERLASVLAEEYAAL